MDFGGVEACDFPGVGYVAIDELAALLGLAAIALAFAQHPKGGIGKPESAALIRHDIVRAVQPFALVSVDQRMPLTIRLLSHDAALAMRGRHHTALAVERMPVLKVGLFQPGGHATLCLPTADFVGLDVTPDQTAIGQAQRAFCPLRLIGQQLDAGLWGNQLAECRIDNDLPHRGDGVGCAC